MSVIAEGEWVGRRPGISSRCLGKFLFVDKTLEGMARSRENEGLYSAFVLEQAGESSNAVVPG